MRFVPGLPIGLGDQKLIKLFTDIVRSLTGVLDLNTYKLTIVWNPPITLNIPTYGNMPRTSSPDIVRCARAVDPTDRATPVHFGATQWSWLGGGHVRLDDVDGLVAGVKYELTFEAVG